jgi:hypothetical protein
MKLSVGCLASSLPSSVLRTGSWAESAVAAPATPVRAAVFDLDDEDIPTTIHLPAFHGSNAAAPQRA